MGDGVVTESPHCAPDGEAPLSSENEISALRVHLAELEREKDERTHLAEQLRLEELRFEALFTLSQMAYASLEDVTEFALEQGVVLTRSTIGYLAFLNEDESILTMHAWSKAAMSECSIQNKPMKYNVGETGLWGEAVRKRRPIITNEYDMDAPLCKGYPEGHVKVLRHMNVPIFDGDHIVIVAGVGNKEDPYEEGDARQLMALMNGTWGLIQRQRMEKELRTSEQRYRLLVETMSDGLGSQSTDGVLTYVNRKLAEMLGYAREEGVGQPTIRFVHPDDIPKYRRQLAIHREGVWESYELAWVAKDGHKVHTVTSPMPIVNPDGTYREIFAVITDISKLKEAEQALRESEVRFRQILENSSDLIYKRSLVDGAYEYISPSIVSLTGFTEQEAMAMGLAGVRERVHPNDIARVMENDKACIEKGPGQPETPSIEYRFMHRDGEYRWFGEAITILYDADSQPVSRIGTIRDVTQRKQSEAALLAASRMEATATLAGGIAHDFNNLMVGVLGNAELIQIRMPERPDLKRMLGHITASAQQAGKLAQQMLAFARGGKYQPASMNLNEIVNDTLQLEKHSFPPRIRLFCDAKPDLWSIMADPVQMSQVIMNLSLNAVEAIEGNGRVSISTKNIEIDKDFAALHPGLQAGHYVYLCVEDTGKGMPPEVRARVFEPFYTTKFQGRGLGLAAVYGIVKNHQGHISVYSQEGVGTSFKIYLPAADVALPAARPQQLRETLCAGTETVLLIDDEEIVQCVTAQILEELGYRVILARNGLEAVEIAKTFDGDIHLALLDMGMPIMGGAQTFPLLIQARPKLKVVICSGYELDPAAQDLLDAGASAFIQKPFRAQTLANALREAIESSR